MSIAQVPVVRARDKTGMKTDRHRTKTVKATAGNLARPRLKQRLPHEYLHRVNTQTKDVRDPEVDNGEDKDKHRAGDDMRSSQRHGNA